MMNVRSSVQFRRVKKVGDRVNVFFAASRLGWKCWRTQTGGGASFQEHFVQLFFEAKQKGQGGQRRGRGRLMIQDQFAPASPPAGAQKWPHKNILYPLFFNGGGALLVPTRYRHCEAAPSFCLFLASRNNFLPCWFLSAPCNDFYRASDSRAHQTLNLGFFGGQERYLVISRRPLRLFLPSLAHLSIMLCSSKLSKFTKTFSGGLTHYPKFKQSRDTSTPVIWDRQAKLCMWFNHNSWLFSNVFVAR